MATKTDDFISEQIQGTLDADEQILNTAFITKAPGILMTALLFGGLIAWLMTTGYYAVATNKRILLIETSLGFFGPSLKNKGVTEIRMADLAGCETGGFLNNRSMTFKMTDGSKRTLRIAPWFKKVTGQGDFFKEVPDRITNRQLEG